MNSDQVGASNSSAVVVYQVEALARVRARRPEAQPNTGFLIDLKKWQKKYHKQMEDTLSVHT